MPTFLLAHTNSAGNGIAQAEITADPVPELVKDGEVKVEGMTAEQNAKRQFRILYPGRTITTIGIKEG